MGYGVITNEQVGQVTIRRARPDDAEKLIAHFKRLAAEPGIFLSYNPDEIERVTVDEEVASIERHDAPNSFFLVAEAPDDDNRIIADLDCKGDRWETDRHVTKLGMSIDKEWRNKGLGSSMVRQAIAWAKGSGIVERIELEVYAPNKPAIHLYEKFGFEIEGSKRRCIFQRGEYFDVLIMALLLVSGNEQNFNRYV